MQWIDPRAKGWPAEIAAEFAKVAADCLIAKPKKRADSTAIVCRLELLLQVSFSAAIHRSSPCMNSLFRMGAAISGDDAATRTGSPGAGGEHV